MAGHGKRMAALVIGVLAACALTGPPAHGDGAVHGGLTSGDPLFPRQGNSGYDVGHYDLDLTWHPSDRGGGIDATTTISATTTGPPLSSFGLDLEGLVVDSVAVDGARAGFVRLDGTGTKYPARHKLVVTPATPVSGDFTVVVHYHGTPVTHLDADGSSEGWFPTSDGATFVNQPIGAMTGFPNNDTPTDKATYTFHIDVPKDLVAASNGELASSVVTGGRRTWVWNETRPMASELATVSIGDYDVLESTVHLSGGRTIPEWSFVDSSLPQATKDEINAERAQLSTTLSGLEALFGPYPGLSTGLIVDNVDTGYALETQDRPTFPYGIDHDTVVHELTHQWYGDAVSPTEWNDLWINEGMATWSPVHESGTSTYDIFHGAWARIPADDPRWSVPPAAMRKSAELFGFQSYARGAMTYEALRTLLGDSRFLTLVRKWQQRYAGGSHGTADLIALAERISGQDLTAFFQDWLFDPGKPDWPTPLPPSSTT